MASSYKSLKCDCCAGSLEYNKQKKVWICLYCGNQIRREEQYDSQFTIKNVVKQALKDLAGERLDSAIRNVSECEKMDARYVGTTLARLCANFFTVIGGACDSSEMKSLFGRIKRDYETLQELDSAISTEEEALYESFEGDADAFGVLYLTFDSIGDQVHKDFVERLMDCGAIYSRSLNGNLLNIFMKNGKLEQADRILANVDCIDCKNALQRVLDSYPDGEQKRTHVAALVPKSELNRDDRPACEHYLTESGDAPATKQAVYCTMAAAGAGAAINVVTEEVLEQLSGDREAVHEILSTIARQKPNDQELYYLLERVMLRHDGEMAAEELRVLAEQELFVAMPGRYVSSMLERRDLSQEEKRQLLELTHRFHMDAKTNDSILSTYLCSSACEPEERLVILPELLAHVKTISTHAMEAYVLNCAADGGKKPQILELLFGLELNMSFFRDLLKKYMQNSPDSDDVRAEVIRILGGQGLQVDGALLVEMACNATEATLEETVRNIDKALRNGTRMPNDALSIYLERCGRKTCYPTLMAQLQTSASRISVEALHNYILCSHDDPSVKVQNALNLAELMAQPFGSTPCRVKHLGNSISCNLLQAYVLITKDDDAAADAIVEAMLRARTRLNSAMVVGGENVTFKRYATEHKGQLSPTTLRLCTENRVFSLFF